MKITNYAFEKNTSGEWKAVWFGGHTGDLVWFETEDGVYQLRAGEHEGKFASVILLDQTKRTGLVRADLARNEGAVYIPLSDVFPPLPAVPLFSGKQGYAVPSFGESEPTARAWAAEYEAGNIKELRTKDLEILGADGRIYDGYISYGDYYQRSESGLDRFTIPVEAVRLKDESEWWKADPREGKATFFYSYTLKYYSFFPPRVEAKELERFFGVGGLPLEREGAYVGVWDDAIKEYCRVAQYSEGVVEDVYGDTFPVPFPWEDSFLRWVETLKTATPEPAPEPATTNSSFWLVAREPDEGNGFAFWSRYRHDSYESARSEAARLADENRGSTFYVLEVKGGVTVR